MRKLALAAIGCLVWQTANADLPKAIFTNLPGSTTSDVPGLSTVKFNPGNTVQFGHPVVSSNGLYWAIRCATTLTASANEVIIRGSGPGSLGAQLVVREGTQSVLGGSINYGVLDTIVGVNASGHVAFTADTTAASTTDEVAVVWDGSNQTLMAREGDAIPGTTGNYGISMDAAHLLDAGDMRFRHTGNPSTRQLLMSVTSPTSGTVIAETDVTVPLGQLESQSIDLFNPDRFRSSADGSNYVFVGDLNGSTATDLVGVYSGTVVVQEGTIVPGSGFTATVSTLGTDSTGQFISHDNAYWMFRGSNTDGMDWVYGNGVVLARKGNPIFAGASENFSDVGFAALFFSMTGNASGDYMIGGVTNATNTNANAVLVLNNAVEIVRENDPLDIDGDGLADDDAFVGVFNNDDAFFTMNGDLYFCCDIRNGAGTIVGQGFFTVPVPHAFADSVNVVAGEEFEGSIRDTFASDDSYYSVFNDAATLQARIELEGKVPYSTLSSFTIRFEGSVARPGLAQAIDAYRYATNSFVNVNGIVATTSDSTVSATVSTAASDYVSGNTMRARITWNPINDEDPAQDGWLHRVDAFRWDLAN